MRMTAEFADSDGFQRVIGKEYGPFNQMDIIYIQNQ